MSRLIDADSIPWHVQGVGYIPVITQEEIDEIPTVDAVPVVRCKDCKWYRKTKHYCGTDYRMPTVTPDFYCAKGERKDVKKSI